MRALLTAALMLPVAAFADGLTVTDAWSPLAPPKAMAHAVYMTLTNTGDSSRQIIGVSADGYAMAHMHRSADHGGVATMSSVDLIEIAPGQSIALAQGGLHIMLMRPDAPRAKGDEVTLTLEFADGSSHKIRAPVLPLTHGL